MPSVVIDPGHGGAARVGGSSANNAVGPNGLLEKDVVLDVGRRVAALLASRATVTLTRSGDENRSLADRARAARDANADVFVSIHLNGWRDPAVDGSEAWVAHHASPASRALARGVLDRVLAVTQARDRGVQEADFGVLLPDRIGPTTAASLVELAFLTNPAEAARLADDGYKQQLAQAIADGIADRLPALGAVAQTLAAIPNRLDGFHPSSNNATLPSVTDLISDDISYVIHRASHGLVPDPFYAGPTAWRYDEARRSHLIVGAFHYAQAHEPNGQKYLEDQADTLVGVVKRLLPGDLPPTFDFEEQDNTKDVSWRGKEWLAPMSAFLDRVETALGRVPMIYSQQSVWHDYIEDVDPAVKDDAAFAYLSDYPLWVIDITEPVEANRYQSRSGSPANLPKPWHDAHDSWAIWQYSNDFTPTEFTRLQAIDAKSDMDVTNGGVHVLRGLADLGRPAPYGSGDRFVAYAQQDGEVAVRSLRGGSWVDEGLRQFAAGDVTACWAAGKEYIAYTSRTDGNLYELERGSADGPQNLTLTGARPLGHFAYVDGGDGTDRLIAYWGEDDHVHLLANRSGTWQLPMPDFTDGPGVPTPSGTPIVYVSGGAVHVVARTTDADRVGHLWDAWYDGNQWQKRDLTSVSGAPASTYRHTSYTDLAGNTCFVFRAAPQPRANATALRGQIHRITSDLHDENLSELSGAPTCAGSPDVFVLEGELHVVYRRPDGNLHEIYQAGGNWHQLDLACRMQAAADPAVFVDPFGGRRTAVVYAVYRGRDGTFYESKLEADTWTCSAQS
ncbi:MAG TPA: N-acetylmuramoyl-L-alanine amidase [Gaiellaceae bacterium]|jgi:N-acetylmuramoyl-L-alanine amidase/GH25 family lysozyme M1 (1,4-beta-N-acetylmuramidase)|nr:N-acetylmuramoyl-L-alanine amidase [Gaiellaceae bacterium]